MGASQRFSTGSASQTRPGCVGRAFGCMGRLVILAFQLAIIGLMLGIIGALGRYIYLSNQLAGAIEQVVACREPARAARRASTIATAVSSSR